MLFRSESRNWRDRTDTPNSSSTALGAAPSTNPNALTRYKFPTSAVGALPAGAFQPAWREMTDITRYSSPNSYVDQTLIRGAISFTNVVSTRDDRWHLLAGVRRDHGENNALTGTTVATISPPVGSSPSRALEGRGEVAGQRRPDVDVLPRQRMTAMRRSPHSTDSR